MSDDTRTRTRTRGAGSASSSRQRKSAGEVTDEQSSEESIPVDDLPANCVRVRVGGGITRNMGDMNFVKVSVEVEMPCAPDNVQKCYEDTALLVDEMINKELDAATAN